MSMSRYRDRLGKPVPRRLEVVWRGRASLTQMRNNLHNWRGGLAGAVAGAMQPQCSRSFSAFTGVPMEEISKLVSQIDGLLTASMPQLVCQCKERYCQFCEGKGWLNASDARRILNQRQLSALSASLSQRPQSEEQASWSAARTSESAILRILWLLAGPPELSSLADDPETALESRAELTCTTT